jgi:hypothetical protein
MLDQWKTTGKNKECQHATQLLSIKIEDSLRIRTKTFQSPHTYFDKTLKEFVEFAQSG